MTRTKSLAIRICLASFLLAAAGCGEKVSDTQAEQPSRPAVPPNSVLWQHEGHQDTVTSVAISPDGTLVASGADAGDSKIHIRERATGELVSTIETALSWKVAFSPTGEHLFGAGRGTIGIWSLDSTGNSKTIDNVSISARALAVSPDGAILASGGLESQIRLWDAASGSEAGSFSLDRGYCWCVAFSPDGQLLAAGGSPDIDVFDLSTGQKTLTLKTYPEGMKFDANIDTFAVAFSPDSTQIATAGADMVVRLWDVSDGALAQSHLTNQAVIKTMAFSPDGSRLAIGTYRGLFLLEPATGSVETLLDDKVAVNAVAFSPDGAFLAAGSDDRSVALWSVG